MKNIKALFSVAIMLCSTLVFSANANAKIIKESVYGGGANFGAIHVGVDDSLINSGLGLQYVFWDFWGDAGSDAGMTFENVIIPFADGFNLTVNLFEAAVDVDNIDAGIEYFYLEAEDDGGWAYQYTYDAAIPGANMLQVVEFLFDPPTLALPQVFGADVTMVSEPTLFGVFALAFAGMALRRRRAA